ncbi:MAG: hypothetical protein JWO62_2645 [Acidimicrobiaceae bacterium]|nr:hypothetical protein [Acidimicrobiaceae bacterium]
MPPPRTITVELNVVVSGNKRTETQARDALASAGFGVIAAEDPRHQSDDWQLPSYTDPITAEQAGQPNSGHTPNTKHPEVLRWLVLENDHLPGCTRISREAWLEAHPEYEPQITKIPFGEEDPDLFREVDEDPIYEDDPRLFLPCEHVGQLEERGHECQHVGEPYAKDSRIVFVGATINVEAAQMSAAVSKAQEVLEPLGWQLRRHWETQALPPKLTPAQKLALLGFEPGELRELLGGN